ncbi:hypothetical protein LIER_19662 [Lithospermum erythrorhizon]|uniref:Uncharacterized protein n=1 Tax=Lithospermum erythrorhizon TaxID=34254 RepID=A0AAV3QP45_LITER
MSLDEGESSKKKGISLKATLEDVDNEDLVKTMNVLAKNFNKTFKRFNKNPYGGTSFPKEEDGQKEKFSNFIAFTVQIEPTVEDSLHENSEDEEDITKEELLEDNTLLYTKWTELTGVFTKPEVERSKLKRENKKLMRIIVERDEEIQNLNAQLKSLNQGIMMMNSSTNILEEIMEVGKYARYNTGISYEKGKLIKQKEQMKFVPIGGHKQPITFGTNKCYRKRNNRLSKALAQLTNATSRLQSKPW